MSTETQPIPKITKRKTRAGYQFTAPGAPVVAAVRTAPRSWSVVACGEVVERGLSWSAVNIEARRVLIELVDE